MSMHCTADSKTNDEREGIEVIDLCSENQTKNSDFCEQKGKHKARKLGQNKKQNNCEDGE